MLVVGGAANVAVYATGIDGTNAETARKNGGVAALGAALAAIGTGLFLLGTF
ncbi:hypothetical protein [Natronococcus sp.]|uniref:hypothetical protein n=1 Tax=Natronococcus sp. TaxID=35747 RepID=UPI003A4DCCEB